MVVGKFKKRVWITRIIKMDKYLQQLESEAIYIIREVAAQFETVLCLVVEKIVLF